jgi:hypothetical protein
MMKRFRIDFESVVHELLGHKWRYILTGRNNRRSDVKTTMIYIHVLNRRRAGFCGPIDGLQNDYEYYAD